MPARFVAATVLAVAAFLTVGCHGITTPSSNVTDTFSDTLSPQGAKGWMFSVSKTGEMTAKLTAWGPNSNLLVGLAWTAANSDGSCTASAIQQNNFVPLNSQALSGQILSGKYCIFIFDVGTLTAAQTYTITVSHPS